MKLKMQELGSIIHKGKTIKEAMIFDQERFLKTKIQNTIFSRNWELRKGLITKQEHSERTEISFIMEQIKQGDTPLRVEASGAKNRIATVARDIMSKQKLLM